MSIQEAVARVLEERPELKLIDSDPEIRLRSIKSGEDFEPGEFEHIVYVPLYARALRLCTGILNDEHKAEDAVQSGFLQIYRKIGSYAGKNGAHFDTWAFRIFHNEALQQIKMASRRIKEEYVEDLGVFGEDRSMHYKGGPLDPENLTINKIRFEYCQTLMEKLTSNQKQALDMRLEGLTMQEIADILNITSDAAKLRVYHAKNFLKKGMERYNARDY